VFREFVNIANNPTSMLMHKPWKHVNVVGLQVLATRDQMHT